MLWMALIHSAIKSTPGLHFVTVTLAIMKGTIEEVTDRELGTESEDEEAGSGGEDYVVRKDACAISP
jgi:hypothetical protein